MDRFLARCREAKLRVVRSSIGASVGPFAITEDLKGFYVPGVVNYRFADRRRWVFEPIPDVNVTKVNIRESCDLLLKGERGLLATAGWSGAFLYAMRYLSRYSDVEYDLSRVLGVSLERVVDWYRVPPSAALLLKVTSLVEGLLGEDLDEAPSSLGGENFARKRLRDDLYMGKEVDVKILKRGLGGLFSDYREGWFKFSLLLGVPPSVWLKGVGVLASPVSSSLLWLLDGGDGEVVGEVDWGVGAVDVVVRDWGRAHGWL